MLEKSEFAGVWTALATPFKSGGGEIDWTALEKLIALQVSGGVRGVVVSGTTGESPTLTSAEKIMLIKRVRAVLPNEIRLMAGTGSNCTKDSIELSRLACEAGADSLLVVTPPYNKPNPSGLKLHYQAISEAVKVPICLYHVPSRTAQSLSLATLTELTLIPRVTVVKEASADLAFFSRARNASKAIFLSGDDSTYLPSLSVGGQGTISVLTNLYPRAVVQMTQAFNAGQTARAEQINKALTPMIDALFCESNPCPLKAALASRGIAQNVLRLPLAPVSPANMNQIEQVLARTDRALQELQCL